MNVPENTEYSQNEGKRKKTPDFHLPHQKKKTLGEKKKAPGSNISIHSQKVIIQSEKKNKRHSLVRGFPLRLLFLFFSSFSWQNHKRREREKTDEGAFHYADISANMRGRKKKKKITESSTLVCGWIKNDDDKGNIFLFITACKGRKAFALSCSLLPNMH